MRVGLIARTEDRGLGNLTWEWAQHMRPDRVMIVVPEHQIPQRIGRYTEWPLLIQKWDHHGDGRLNEEKTREWLRGLDVVYSAETFYDWRICTWARELGVRTVCHVMPEYYRHGHANPPPTPDAWWTPTRWRLDLLAPGTRVVPVPVALERFPAPTTTEQPPRWLHIAGAPAAADRNGTRLLLGALFYLRAEHCVKIRTQERRMVIPRAGRRVHLEVVTEPAREYWDLYGDADLMVLPRRYAGLSLPAQEAMAAGLALAMSDVEPQASEWPILPIGAVANGRIRTAAGPIELVAMSPRDLADRMDEIARDAMTIAHARAESRRWAHHNSWERLAPLIRSELETVLACAPGLYE